MTLTEARKVCRKSAISASYFSKETGQQCTVRVRDFTMHREGDFTIHTNDGPTERLTADRVAFFR